MPRHNPCASLQSDETTPKFQHLRSQLLTDQRLPYTSGGSARGVALNTEVPLVGATVCGDGSDKLDAACPVLRTSTSASLRPLRSVVVSSLRGVVMLTVTRQ